jgi:hypothetical protein
MKNWKYRKHNKEWNKQGILNKLTQTKRIPQYGHHLCWRDISPMTLGHVIVDWDRNEKSKIFPHKQMCKLKNNYFSLEESREKKKEKVCTLNPSLDVDPCSSFSKCS